MATFLPRLRGQTPIVRIAELAQRNRYTVARWLDGSSEPRLPDFLRLVDVTSGRLLELIAALEDLHMQYVRATQEVIASSTPSECVGLYCAQLLDRSSVGARSRMRK